MANHNPLSASQKELMAEGRRQSAAVHRYLEALALKAKDPEAVEKKIKWIDSALPTGDTSVDDALKGLRVRLAALARRIGTIDMADAERDFVLVASTYGDKRSIGHRNWRALWGSSPRSRRGWDPSLPHGPQARHRGPGRTGQPLGPHSPNPQPLREVEGREGI